MQMLENDLPIDIDQLPTAGNVIRYELPQLVSVDLIAMADPRDPAGRSYRIWVAGWATSELGECWHFIKASEPICGPWTAVRLFNRAVRWASMVRAARLQVCIAQAQQLLMQPEEVVI